MTLEDAAKKQEIAKLRYSKHADGNSGDEDAHWILPMIEYAIDDYIAYQQEREGELLGEKLKDFFLWFRANGETHIGISIEEMIELYKQSLKDKG